MIKGRSRIYWYFLYPLVAVLFAIACVFFILSAKGYNFKFEGSHLRVEKTGMIIVASHPSGAEIYLDGKRVSGNALPFFSTKIDGLLPGDYRLTLKKEGFQTWEKKLRVLPEAVTWADYALLFPQEKTTEKISLPSEKIGKIIRSDSSDYSLLQTVDKKSAPNFLVINNSNGEVSDLQLSALLLGNLLSDVEVVDWSENRKLILLRAKKADAFGYYLIDTTARKIVDVAQAFKISFDALSFNQTDSNLLLGIKSGGLYIVNLSASSVSTTVDLNVLTAIGREGKLYYIKSNLAGKNLIQANIDGTNKLTITSAVPEGTAFEIKIGGNQRIALYSRTAKTLHVIEKENNRYQLLTLGTNIDEFGWANERLFFKGGDSFQVTDFEKEKDWQISLKDCSGISWYDNHHLIAKNSGKIVVMDFDGANIVSFEKSTKNFPILFSKENKNIFFIEQGLQDLVSFYKAKF